ncbi:MAG: TonB-dependent receptor [Candidatus Zixiibacteriota bacterium]
MRNMLFFIIILIFSIGETALAGTFAGRLIDSEGEPIIGATVQTDIKGVYDISDEMGQFELNSKNEQLSYITFSHVSYQPLMMKISKFINKQDVVLSPAVYKSQNIRVTAMRAEAGLTPSAFADFTADDVARDYTVGDFPLLLESTPNMYAYSYTGGATGASDFKIRGFDYKRIGVYVNGIPLNDPEDRFTYFYDLPDFASDVADIQVQRGVGNSLYGDASFGGSINIASESFSNERKISLSSGYGAFMADGKAIGDIRKNSLEYTSGIIDGRWSFAGRYSKLYSDGYREGAWYDGWAYFFSLSRIDPKMLTTVNLYGGPMKAHLAFDGIDRDHINDDRRYNPATYKNEIDDFNQPHYELHNTCNLSENITLNNTLYYIRGEGYYEQFKEDQYIGEYNIDTSMLVDVSQNEINIIRQKWVTKNQYGWNSSLKWNHNRGTAIFGSALYYFDSEHWGDVIWAENVSDAIDRPHQYYQYSGKKISSSIYALENYSLSGKFKLMGNLQLRYLNYNFDQTRLGALPGYNYSIDWLFLSPRLGLTYFPIHSLSVFGSFGISSREPADMSIYDAEDVSAIPQLRIENLTVSGSDTTYHFGDPFAKPERLYDFELGADYRTERFRIGLNLFWMEFKNEIIYNGALDDNGLPRLGNADRSVHTGAEFDAAANITSTFRISGNLSYNHNRFKEYTAYNDINYDGSVIDTVDYSGNPVAGFPDYLGNITVDWNIRPVRLVYRFRAVGKQYVENGKNEDFAIDNYTVSSLTASASLGKLSGIGKLSLMATVNNLFNAKYEQSGYAYIWYGDEWVAEYYPAAERNFYIQLKWELE